MLDKYITFDIEKFISDYPDNKVMVEQLTEQLDDLITLPGMSDDVKVQTMPSADGIVNIVIRREKIMKDIEEYQGAIRQFERAWDRLSEREQIVIREFYFENQSSSDAVLSAGDQLDLESRRIYEIRKDAVQRIKKLVFGC